MRTAVIFLILLLPCVAFPQQDRCYPGLDCPGDIPRGSPPQIPKRSRDENPPPRRPVPDMPRVSPQSLQQCSDPYEAMINQMFLGQSAQSCTLPSTHCCTDNGFAVPLQDTSENLPFGSPCSINLLLSFRQGLTCRR